MAHDLRVLLRLAQGRPGQPPAAVRDACTLPSSIESGESGDRQGHERRKGTKLHLIVDTLGNLLAAHVTAADEQDRVQVGQLAAAVEQATCENVEIAFVDQGYTGKTPAQAAAADGVALEVAKHAQANRGFVLLPMRWVVERSHGRAMRFHRLVRDYERLPTTPAGLHFVAFATLMLLRIFALMQPASA